MPPATFERYVCWKEERIGKVINKEAVSVDRANFLVTHAPLNHIRYGRAPHQIQDTSEDGLLAELQASTRDGQHVFMVVQGVPGTGKSHLIRWLKEQYLVRQPSGQTDVVLLIERANCNLRGTLEQIINCGVFNSQALSEQLKKLRSATGELKRDSLGDSLLNSLQVAAKEVELPADQRPHRSIASNIESFLLDPPVRAELKKPHGPIDRLIRFLSADASVAVRADELPGFQPNDFNFRADLLRALQKTRPETQELAEKLNLREERRVELANYLNRLLNYAVGRTTTLTSEDLKEMFKDLRRELRRQNKNLALFIEDITAFTGIDAGLVDVLATQHTGEGNRDFCRLLSVIGITDSYYDSRFPDNMKDRVTHQLTLNAGDPGGLTVESEMLQSPDALADIAARYLNAMRLSQAQVEDWSDTGARADTLPNFCASCPFIEPCHSSFGAVELASGAGTRLRVGLYPFNRQALLSMYRNLRTTYRTPRSFLNSVLEYVLQSHGQKVEEGKFPPPPGEMGGEFTTPPFRKPGQNATLEYQARNDKPRVESLLRIWGDGTADSVSIDGQRRVGTLPEAVFRAFSLPFIEGEQTADVPAPPQPVKNDTEPGSRAGGTTAIGDQANPPGVAPPPAEPAASKYLVDLSGWQENRQLQYYEYFANLLANLIRGYVDWEGYAISAAQVSDRISAGHIFFQGQAGQPDSDYLSFPRSSDTANTLASLTELFESNKQPLNPSTLGGHMIRLSNWLASNEHAIVEFARKPSSKSEVDANLANVLVTDAFYLHALSGQLTAQRQTPSGIFLDLVGSATASNKWEDACAKATQSHTQSWASLMSSLGNGSKIGMLRRQLLIALNRAQGDMLAILSRSSGDGPVWFFDAALAIAELGKLQNQGWRPGPLPTAPAGSGAIWADALAIHSRLQQHLSTVLDQEHSAVVDLDEKLRGLMGEHSAQEVSAAIDSLLEMLRQQQQYYAPLPGTNLTPSGLDQLRSGLEALVKGRTTSERLVIFSASEQLIHSAKLQIKYFEAFCTLAASKEQELLRRRSQLQATSAAAQLEQSIEDAYQAMDRALSAASSPGSG